MDLLEIAKLLNKNANDNIDIFVWDLVQANKNLMIEREKVFAENMELRATVNTLKEVIQSLTHQHEDKGE